MRSRTCHSRRCAPVPRGDRCWTNTRPGHRQGRDPARSLTPLDPEFLTTIAEFDAIAIEKPYYLSTLMRISSQDELTYGPAEPVQR